MKSFIVIVLCFVIASASVETEQKEEIKDETRSSTYTAPSAPCELSKLFLAQSNYNQGNAAKYATQIAQLYAILNAINSVGTNSEKLDYNSHNSPDQANHVAPISYQTQTTLYNTGYSAPSGEGAAAASASKYTPAIKTYSGTNLYGNKGLAPAKKLIYSPGSGTKYGGVPASYATPAAFSTYSTDSKDSKSYSAPATPSISSGSSSAYGPPASSPGYVAVPTSYSAPASTNSGSSPSYSAQVPASYSSAAPPSATYSGANAGYSSGRTPSAFNVFPSTSTTSMNPSVANLYSRFASTGAYGPEKATTYNYSRQNGPSEVSSYASQRAPSSPSSAYGASDAVVPVPVCPKNYMFSCQANIKQVPCEQPAGASY